MEFKDFAKQVKTNFTKLQQNNKLYKSSLSGDDLWNLYINNFKAGDNPVFRDPNSSSHNDNLDKAFVRRYGNIVAINEDTSISTMWDGITSSKYENPCKVMSEALKSSIVQDVFKETFEELNSLPYEKCNKQQSVFRLGVEFNHKIYSQEESSKFGVVEAGKSYRFYHFHTDLDKSFVDVTGRSQASIMSDYRSSKEVFKRAMEEFSIDTLKLVRDLINQGSILNSEHQLDKISKMISFKEVYDSVDNSKKDNYCWATSYNLPYAKFRNESIGTLVVELSQGKEINEACLMYNKMIDPANYMKAVTPITERQRQDVRKFAEENGYLESFDRRFATIDDINVNEILHSNNDASLIKTASIFDKVKTSNNTRHKKSKFEGVEEVNIDKFMNTILPTCTSIELFLENRLESNLVSLTTANNLDSKKMFKWNNNFSWTYNGNLAGKSQIKEQVKEKGGKVDGVLRFSIMWADGDGDNSDLDAHCIEPNGNEIYFSNKRSTSTHGNLDIDITQPGGDLAVENITFPSLAKLKNGNYTFFVRQYASRGSKGFKAEIEFEGEIYQYEYNSAFKGDVRVGVVNFKNGVFSIEHKLPETTGLKTIWQLETNQFHQVNLACLSPNYWGDNNFGNKHYMFMLENCNPTEPIRSFHNENLNAELLPHRKVLDVLANMTMLDLNEKSLSGVGFNSTVRDEVILKLEGTHKRTIKVKF